MPKLLIGVISIGFILLSTSQVYSQEKSELEKQYEASFDEYQTALDEYKKSHEDYVLARSQYQRFQTLTSQNNARNATIRMLQERDEVIIGYLESLKKKLVANESIDDTRRTRLISQIDEEINWFAGHKERTASAGTLEEVIEDSDEAKERYDLMQPIVFEALAVLPFSNTNRFGQRLQENFDHTKAIIRQIRDESRPEYTFDSDKLERIDKWSFDTETKIARGNEKLTKASAIIDSLSGTNVKGIAASENIYNNLIRELVGSIADFKDASLYNREIIKEVKTK